MDYKKSVLIFFILILSLFLVEGVFALTSVTVTSPNGGEILKGVVNINWDAEWISGPIPTHFAIAYQTDGSGWQYITTGSGDLGNNIPITERTATWDTRVLAGATNYYVKVVAMRGITSDGEDNSNGVFTIDNAKPISSVNALTPYKNTTINLRFSCGRCLSTANAFLSRLKKRSCRVVHSS